MDIRAILQPAYERAQQGYLTEAELHNLVQSLEEALRHSRPAEPGVLEAGRLFQAIETLAAIAEVSAGLDIDQIAAFAAEKVLRLFQAQACWISSWDDTTGNLSLRGKAEAAEADHPELSISPRAPANLPAEPFLLSVLAGKDPLDAAPDTPHLDPTARTYLHQQQLPRVLFFPMFIKNRANGLIQIDAPQTAPAHGPLLQIGQMLASQTAAAFESSLLFQEVRLRSIELEAIHRIGLSLTASLNLTDVLDAILSSIFEIAPGYQSAHIFLYEKGVITFGSSLFDDGRTGIPWSEPRPDGLTYTVARLGQMKIIPDMQANPIYAQKPEWTGAIVGLPLKIRERVVGVMTVAYHETHSFTESEIRLLRLLGDQAAIAIENARLHEMVNQQAHTDPLTGLANRRALDERLVEEVRRSKRYHHPFALVMIDLNQFKAVNDTFGHPVGDLVLQQFSSHLRKTVRDTDFLARYGGDEFALILPETDLVSANRIIHRLSEQMGQWSPELPEKQKCRITAGMGIAVFPLDAETPTGLIEAADRALYQVKKAAQSATRRQEECLNPGDEEN